MIKFLLAILMSFSTYLQAQNFRDNFLGTYSGNVFRTYGGSAPTYKSGGSAIVSISSIDTNYIQIILSDTTGHVTREYLLNSDSSFTNTIMPNVSYGKFFNVDSIFIQDNYLSPTSDLYYCRKIQVDVFELNALTISFYPNPVQNKLIITETSNFNEVVIYSLKGNLVYSKELNKDFVEIDVSKFENGIYFVRCSTTTHSIVKKILVQH